MIPFPVKSTINTRRSARSFKMCAVEDEAIGSLKAFTASLICECHVWLGLCDKEHEPAITVAEDSGCALWKIHLEKGV